MNETKRCSISGIGFTFDKVAYTRLKEYLASIESAYAKSSDKEEILADIEAHIAEMILSAQSSGAEIVTLPLVENIISQLGTAEDISGEESRPEQSNEPRIPRRLYRNMEESRIGGVCSGLARYFDIDPVVVRLLATLPFVLLVIFRCFDWDIAELFSGIMLGVAITYLILWFAVPAAKSARQKLEMEGETVTIKAIADRQSDTPQEQARSSIATFITLLGRIAVVLLKIFVAIMLFPLVMGCLAMIVGAIAIVVGTGAGIADFIHLGHLGTLNDMVATHGLAIPLLSIGVVALPTAIIAYLFVTLLRNKRPRRWVLITGFLLTCAMFIALLVTVLSGVQGATTSEVERIMRKEEVLLP
ncbi:MAG: PspC domain-containing protein [Alistipes sp.]|nr:PspC domain-containing protein [Alistipes sp.]